MVSEESWLEGEMDPEHAYLDGARQAWAEHEDWMDFQNPESPIFPLKRIERDLYLHHWGAALSAIDLSAATVLDVGCGVGRFSHWFIEQGATVYGVDADLMSLQRLVWRADGPGRLDVFWNSVHNLPEVQADVVVAAEVLCYVPRMEDAMAEVFERLKPGGTFLLSMEARYGWAVSADAPSRRIDVAIEDHNGVVYVEGEGWVRLFERDQLVELLVSLGFVVESIVATHYVTDGPLEQVAEDDLTLERALDLDTRARVHPVWGPLNRIWTVVARRPE